MSAPVLLDISRLIWRGRRTGPSGIDRVELAYAQHFLAADASRPAYAVVHLLGWLFGISPSGARRFVEAVAARWEGGAPEADRTHSSGLLALYRTLFLSRWRVGFQLRRLLKAHREPPIFLVVSHHHLSREYTVRRIRRSFGARCACFLHDLIPIDCPEYFQPGKEQGYWRVARTITRHFDAVIANSETTADSLRHIRSSEPNPTLSDAGIHVARPGARAFPRPKSMPMAPSVSYFIVLGTIEPRKNHLLLLNLWTRLATTMATPPRLLVIGARGWENEQAVDMLERSRRLRGLVEEHNRLSDTAIGSLLSQARALLLPSFAEGFGLPLAEALASGVPVICSDIPVFREAGQDVPDYVDPLDLIAWRDAIVDYSGADSPRRAAQMQRLAHWQAPLWSDHFAIVERALDEAADQ